MSGIAPSIRALTDDLLDRIDRGRWDEADADLETLAHEALAGIVQDRADDLAAIARLTARCHTALSLRREPGPEAMHRLGQLRAIAVMVAAAMNRRRPRPPATLDRADSPTGALLAALRDGPRTGPALAAETGLKPAALSAALSELRAAGLVRSWPAGRLIVSERCDPDR